MTTLMFSDEPKLAKVIQDNSCNYYEILNGIRELLISKAKYLDVKLRMSAICNSHWFDFAGATIAISNSLSDGRAIHLIPKSDAFIDLLRDPDRVYSLDEFLAKCYEYLEVLCL